MYGGQLELQRIQQLIPCTYRLHWNYSVDLFMLLFLHRLRGYVLDSCRQLPIVPSTAASCWRASYLFGLSLFQVLKNSSQKLKQMFKVFVCFFLFFFYFFPPIFCYFYSQSTLQRDCIFSRKIVLNSLSGGIKERHQGSVTAYYLSLASATEGRSFLCHCFISIAAGIALFLTCSRCDPEIVIKIAFNVKQLEDRGIY